MISERTFARSFSGFWTQLLPFLTPNFVHLMNDAFGEPLKDAYGKPLCQIPKSPEIRDAAVIAEFAFFIAQLSIEENLSVYDIIQKKKYSEKAQRYALEVIKKYEGGRLYLSMPLLPDELEEGLSLAVNYERFFETICKNQHIEFGPEIPGAGFISACKADISVETTLFEVKTVDRNLAGKDIRQLVVYLALQGVTGNKRWDTAGFFNPRRSVYHVFNVDDIINQMSGGRPSLEVFQELIDFVSVRDVQFDTKF